MSVCGRGKWATYLVGMALDTTNPQLERPMICVVVSLPLIIEILSNLDLSLAYKNAANCLPVMLLVPIGDTCFHSSLLKSSKISMVPLLSKRVESFSCLKILDISLDMGKKNLSSFHQLLMSDFSLFLKAFIFLYRCHKAQHASKKISAALQRLRILTISATKL